MRCRFRPRLLCVVIIIQNFCAFVYFGTFGILTPKRYNVTDNAIPATAVTNTKDESREYAVLKNLDKAEKLIITHSSERCNVSDITTSATSLFNINEESKYRMAHLQALDEAKKLTISHSSESSLSLEQNIKDQIRSLSRYRDDLSKELSIKIRRRLERLQNPKDCQKARKLYCSLKPPCGLACGVHDLLLCCIEAYRTNKILIVMSSDWYYSPKGWGQFFRPLSNSCPEEIKETEKTDLDWPGFPERKGLSNIYKLPHDIKEQVEQLGSNPMPWWFGQLLGHFFQPNSNLSSFIEENIQTLKFQSPIVGIHVRRTDKLRLEAKYHPIEAYMDEVGKYFKRLEEQENKRIRKRVFLTTEDPAVIEEIGNRYPEYEFIYTLKNAVVEGFPKYGISEEVIKITLLDIFLLARTDFIVCTFSSGFCRLAYELMLYQNPSALGNVVSLDVDFSHQLIADPKRKVLVDHSASLPGEINLTRGDVITDLWDPSIKGLRKPQKYDGCVYGKNHETERSGYYPLYKTQYDFGTLEETHLESLDDQK